MDQQVPPVKTSLPSSLSFSSSSSSLSSGPVTSRGLVVSQQEDQAPSDSWMDDNLEDSDRSSCGAVNETTATALATALTITTRYTRTISNTSMAPPQCVIPFGADAALGIELSLPRKEKYDYLRNGTMTAASAVLLFAQYGIHYYTDHPATQSLSWSSAERCIYVFLAATFCYRAGLNLVLERQSTLQLLLPEILTLGALVLGLVHALRLAALLLTVGAMYLMIFAVSSTVETFLAMNNNHNRHWHYQQQHHRLPPLHKSLSPSSPSPSSPLTWMENIPRVISASSSSVHSSNSTSTDNKSTFLML